MPEVAKKLSLVLLILLLTGGVLPAVGLAEKPFIVVLCDHDKEPYNLIAHTFIAEIAKIEPAVKSKIFHLEEFRKNPETTLKISRRQALMVMALGTQAFNFSQQHFPKSPQIVTMIVEKPTVTNPTLNYTGVLLSTPFDIHLKWLKKFIPGIRKIGLLYNPQQNLDWLTQARKVISATKLELIAEAVVSPQEIPQALKTVIKQCEVLVSLPNPLIYSRKTAKKILLTTFQNRIPLVGPSRAWVKAGALYALEWDFSDIGRQCAVLAQKLRQKEPGQQIDFQTPEKFGYSLNLRTAKNMKLTINEELKNNALQLFH